MTTAYKTAEHARNLKTLKQVQKDVNKATAPFLKSPAKQRVSNKQDWKKG